MHTDTWLSPDAGIPHAWVQSQLNQNTPIAQLDVPMAVTRVFSVRLANRLNRLPTQWLRLWCQVTRSAFRQALLTPELHTLDVLVLRGSDKLRVPTYCCVVYASGVWACYRQYLGGDAVIPLH